MRRLTTVAALAAAVWAALIAVGCPGLGARPSAGGAPHTLIEAAPGQAMFRQSGSLRSDTGCLSDTLLYRPSRPRTDGLAVLAPGFLRDQSHLRDLARALAGRGIPTVTLTPCNTRPWIGRQAETGADMRQLAHSLNARRVVYGGFSSGALSALMAARQDPNTVGVLALDLVDNRDLGVDLARHLDRPLIGLRGEPGRCNASNNGLPVFAAAASARLTPVPGASHCDFESPTDWLCETLCKAADSGSKARRLAVVERSVAAVADLLEVPPDRSR